jgi:hypothetical protein
MVWGSIVGEGLFRSLRCWRLGMYEHGLVDCIL